MQVEQIDRETAAKWAKMQGRPHQAANMRRGACDTAPLVQAFARHRIAERERVVGEIVAMLDERISVYEQKRDKADPLADETYNRHEAITYVLEALEIVKLGMAKFGGRDV